MEASDIANRFNFHPADSNKAVQHDDLRSACWNLATYLNDSLPEGREKSLAITHLEEVMFWGNASLARN